MSSIIAAGGILVIVLFGFIIVGAAVGIFVLAMWLVMLLLYVVAGIFRGFSSETS